MPGMRIEQAMRELMRRKNELTRQQFRVIRGQIRAGDVDAGMRGMETLLKRERKDADEP